MASSKKPKATRRAAASDDGRKPSVEHSGLPIPDFDPAAFDRLLKEVTNRLLSLARRTGELAGTLDTLLRDGSLVSLSQAKTPGDIAGDAAAIVPDMVKDAQELERVAATIKRWEISERRSRRARFEEIARRRGWDLVGAWPEPVVDGIVFIKVDEDRNRAFINGQALPGNPTAERLADLAAGEMGELMRGRPEPTTFVAEVWAAFRECGVAAGQGLNVHRLLRELLWLKQTKVFRVDPRQDGFRPYPMAQFRANLTHYLALGAPTFKDSGTEYRLEAVGGSFAQDAVFMYFPQTGRLASCGRLTFRAVEPRGAL